MKLTNHKPKEKTDDWHFQSMRSAVVLDALGGVSAPDSTLFQRAVSELLLRGYSEQEIVDGYKKRWPK